MSKLKLMISYFQLRVNRNILGASFNPSVEYANSLTGYTLDSIIGR